MLLLDQLPTIERTIRFTCRRAALCDPDAIEDFASHVKLRLIENDYAVLRKYENRSSFAAYIAIVIQRLLLDYRISQWGKWHASTQARRMGEVAITIEAMLYRDGRSFEEALPAIRRRWPELSRSAVEDVARQLPSRLKRPREVPLEAAARIASTVPASDSRPFASHRARLSETISKTVRDTWQELQEPDRTIFRRRFESGMSIADIARTLAVDQKSLYRTVQRLLRLLRERLDAAGVRGDDIGEVFDHREELDFGFDREPLETVDGVEKTAEEEDP